MSFISRIKQFLPPSSRSFHSMYKEMVESNWIVKDTGLKLYEMDARFNERLDELERRLDAHDAHVKMLEWANYRKEGESLDDARKRFYRGLPKAAGSLRLLQLGNAQLLREFDALCKEQGLAYWLDFGTLIGAIRHEGFIPWDDDVDVGMLREDVDRLLAVARESERYCVTEVFDYYVHCRQLRFRYRDESVPCFLDVFVFDYTPSSDPALLERQRALRAEMVQQMNGSAELAHWCDDDAYIDARRDDAQVIKAVFDEFVQREYDCGDYVTKDEPHNGVIFSLDNVEDDLPTYAWCLTPEEALFPLATAQFEGMTLPVPRCSDQRLRIAYGDFLELPDDIHSHIVHVDKDELATSEVQERLRHYVDC